MKHVISISVCMPFYNVEHYIKDAIESVLNQSFQDFEYIMINDGSTDGSLSIAQNYESKDKRIHIINNTHNFIDSLNRGLEYASGRYIARMDADDIMHKDRLLTQYNFLEYNNDISACGAGFKRFDGSSEKYIPMILEPEDIEIAFTQSNCFTIGMIRKDFLDTNHICYNNEYIYAEDYKLWADIILAGGKLANLPQILYYYRTHNKQISSIFNKQMMDSSLLIRKSVIDYLLERDIQKYGTIESMCHIMRDLYNQQIIKIKDYCEITSCLINKQTV